MHRLSLGLASLALFGLNALAQEQATTTYWEPSPPTNTPCSPLELIIARGTGEPGEYGVVVGDPLVNLTLQKIPDATAYPVNYPANWTLGVSISIGINDTVTHLLNQAAKCPDQKYAIIGYSQGAAVVHSAVQSTSLTSSFLEEKVIAFVGYGDPDNHGQGSPGAISVLPDPLKNRLRENCECGDSVCSNGTSFVIHTMYFQPARGYHNITSDYIKKAYDTNGAQGNSIMTSYDPSNNCTLQYCTNTTLGGPPHSTGPDQCGVDSGPSGNTSSSSTSLLPSGTGTPMPSGNSTSPAGTGTGMGTGTGTGTRPTASSPMPTNTGGSTGTGTGAPPPPSNSTRPYGSDTTCTHSTASYGASLSYGGISLPTGSLSLPTGSLSLPTGSISLPTGFLTLPYH